MPNPEKTDQPVENAEARATRLSERVKGITDPNQMKYLEALLDAMDAKDGKKPEKESKSLEDRLKARQDLHIQLLAYFTKWAPRPPGETAPTPDQAKEDQKFRQAKEEEFSSLIKTPEGRSAVEAKLNKIETVEKRVKQISIKLPNLSFAQLCRVHTAGALSGFKSYDRNPKEIARMAKEDGAKTEIIEAIMRGLGSGSEETVERELAAVERTIADSGKENEDDELKSLEKKMNDE